jgi:hypothetical protein
LFGYGWPAVRLCNLDTKGPHVDHHSTQKKTPPWGPLRLRAYSF